MLSSNTKQRKMVQENREPSTLDYSNNPDPVLVRRRRYRLLLLAFVTCALLLIGWLIRSNVLIIRVDCQGTPCIIEIAGRKYWSTQREYFFLPWGTDPEKIRTYRNTSTGHTNQAFVPYGSGTIVTVTAMEEGVLNTYSDVSGQWWGGQFTTRWIKPEVKDDSGGEVDSPEP